MSINETSSGPRSEPNEVKRSHCGAQPRLAQKILNAQTGGTLRMYKCQCGEQMWVDHRLDAS
jgi:hypothetical protein